MNYEIIAGDCLQTLKTLPANSVQTCVTSPPYFNLRDYGTATWEGGDAACDHKPVSDNSKQAATSTLGGSKRNVGNALAGYGDVCGKCGARRIDSQVGLEETPEAYVAKLVDVFREVRRVLRDDGTLWLNLGDSYANNGVSDPSKVGGFTGDRIRRGAKGIMDSRPRAIPKGIKQKDLLGIPWMTAFALRADGWYLRSDIIWHKPNPMPESVTDRPTKAHEYIFLLSKSGSYFYDADAVREVHSGSSGWRKSHADKPTPNGMGNGELAQHTRMGDHPNGRNRRSVWTVTTKPYSGAHFATFPPDLIEPCILAGTSAYGECANCGSPWARVTEPDERIQAHWQGTTQDKALAAKGKHGATSVIATGSYQTYKTVGWEPTCSCNADVVPCTVLDCFSGSGTTGAVALKHGRNYIGCELNEDYISLAHKRIGQAQPLLLLEGAL